MDRRQLQIIFVDNSISRIFNTVESLRKNFPDVIVIAEELELREYLKMHQPGVILIQLDLEPNDGIHLLSDLRQNNIAANSYIVLYGDKQDDFVQQLAYDSGADAFITFQSKPVLLVHFLRNLQRRKLPSEKRRNRPVLLDPERYLVFNNGEAVQLPRKEFRLFELLYNQPGLFLSKVDIALRIWKDSRVAQSRTIDVHIYNIRRCFGKRIIQSQKGKGYRINRRYV